MAPQKEESSGLLGWLGGLLGGKKEEQPNASVMTEEETVPDLAVLSSEEIRQEADKRSWVRPNVHRQLIRFAAQEGHDPGSVLMDESSTFDLPDMALNIRGAERNIQITGQLLDYPEVKRSRAPSGAEDADAEKLNYYDANVRARVIFSDGFGTHWSYLVTGTGKFADTSDFGLPVSPDTLSWNWKLEG